MGSSPLARGLPLCREPRRWRGGIIPARAGFTSLWPHQLGDDPDHPRSRGVYTYNLPNYVGELGSSPLARGLLRDRRPDRHRRGIIPARAGFTPRGRRRPGPRSDHPRSRGVYQSAWDLWPWRHGSSPLARGLRDERVRFILAAGIIPARAGFTRPRYAAADTDTDHPRSRGVYRKAFEDYQVVAGSSPLARGLRTGRRHRRRPSRIIPARAGFTRSTWTCCAPARDHPRSRGVYLLACRPGASEVGSSPLARGLRRYRADCEGERGIIPARAGFTARVPQGPRTCADHPRSRGVYAWRSLESQRSPTLPDGFRLHC